MDLQLPRLRWMEASWSSFLYRRRLGSATRHAHSRCEMTMKADRQQSLYPVCQVGFDPNDDAKLLLADAFDDGSRDVFRRVAVFVEALL